MRFLITLCFTIFLMACQSDQSSEEKLARSTTAVAQTLYGNLSKGLGEMLEKTDGYCHSFPGISKTELQEQWKVIMGQWQAANVIQFGPVTVGSMIWKFQFWPDRRNAVKKKVDETLTEQAKLDLTFIGNANVAARGMGAAEYLLFDSSGLTPESEQCDYLKIVVADMKRNSIRLKRDWQNGEKRYPVELITFAKAQLEAQLESDIDIKPVSSLLINSLYVVLEQNSRKLSLPLAESDTGNSYMAESWRSETSLQNLASSFGSAKSLFLGGNGYGLADRLREYSEEGDLLATEVIASFDRISAGLKQFQKPLAKSVQYSPDRAKVRSLFEEVKHLHMMFGSDIPRLLDIPVSL